MALRTLSPRVRRGAFVPRSILTLDPHTARVDRRSWDLTGIKRVSWSEPVDLASVKAVKNYFGQARSRPTFHGSSPTALQRVRRVGPSGLPPTRRLPLHRRGRLSTTFSSPPVRPPWLVTWARGQPRSEARAARPSPDPSWRHSAPPPTVRRPSCRLPPAACCPHTSSSSTCPGEITLAVT